MQNTKEMQILHCLQDLYNYFFGSLLCYLEVPGTEVVKKVFALHVLKDDVVIVDILEKVKHLDYIWVLAHFEDFYLLSLLVDLNRLHLLLSYTFHCCSHT